MVNIRKGQVEDLPSVLELIKELALFEKAPEKVSNTLEALEIDGFGENSIFNFFVAEERGTILGMSLFYWRYSTWKGRRLYLEDLIVSEQHRGKGLGKGLFEKTLDYAKSQGATGMTWQVLDWNKPAIDFYTKYQTDIEKEWLNCNLDFT